jgi:hypothetical protein
MRSITADLGSLEIRDWPPHPLRLGNPVRDLGTTNQAPPTRVKVKCKSGEEI